eukprot:4397281-Pyramimonas_sp.AAC.1
MPAGRNQCWATSDRRPAPGSRAPPRKHLGGLRGPPTGSWDITRGKGPPSVPPLLRHAIARTCIP